MKERVQQLAALAAEILAASDDVTEIRPLAKSMLAMARERGLTCCYQTCKRHIARARAAQRGEMLPSWGGRRPGAGRPRKEE